MVVEVLVTPAVEAVTNDVKKVELNYDCRPLRPGEVLVAVPENDLFIQENVTNPDSIRTYHAGSQYVKVVLEAFPEEYAPLVRGQLNLVENELNGKYRTKNSVSLEERMENYDLDEADPLVDVEAAVIDSLERAAARNMFEEEFDKILSVSPRLAVAVLLRMKNVQGTDFSSQFGLGHDAANTLRQQADAILEVGLANYDFSQYKGHRCKNEEYYLELAHQILDNLIEWLNEID